MVRTFHNGFKFFLKIYVLIFFISNFYSLTKYVHTIKSKTEEKRVKKDEKKGDKPFHEHLSICNNSRQQKGKRLDLKMNGF